MIVAVKEAGAILLKGVSVEVQSIVDLVAETFEGGAAKDKMDKCKSSLPRLTEAMEVASSLGLTMDYEEAFRNAAAFAEAAAGGGFQKDGLEDDTAAPFSVEELARRVTNLTDCSTLKALCKFDSLTGTVVPVLQQALARKSAGPWEVIRLGKFALDFFQQQPEQEGAEKLTS